MDDYRINYGTDSDYEADNFATMFRNLLRNLTKKQKIIILIVAQILFAIILIVVINMIFKPRSHIDTVDNSGVLKNIPSAEIELYEQALWNIIEEGVPGVESSVINDVVVREDTYNQEESEVTGDIQYQASFIVDIDSIEQTYEIVLGWTRKGETVDPIIQCPPMNEMKYPGTICVGSYDTTYSFWHYLPYYENNENDYTVWEIDGDDATNTITVISSVCNPEKYNAEALEYIKNNTPYYNNPDYLIKYEVNTVDEECEALD